MSALSSEAIFDEIRARGLLHRHCKPQPLGQGNADRHEDHARSVWSAVSPDGTPAKLVIGADLTDFAKRHAEAARECPDIVPALIGHQRMSGCDVLLEQFVQGNAIDEEMASDTREPVKIREALERVRKSMETTERPSTEEARQAEWKTWTRRLLQSEAFAPVDRNLLEQRILPALLPQLCSEAPVTRWTNGDYRGGNILLEEQGRPWLIDFEYGGRTHFFAEDEIRFVTFTPAVRRKPELIPSPYPSDAAWHLFFWLRQFLLEVENNSAAYIARVGSGRRALIRRLAEAVLTAPLETWSVLPTPVDYLIEDARWIQDEELVLHFSGWCHAPESGGIESVVLSQQGKPPTRVLPGTRPDVQAHFAAHPAALWSGFSGRIHSDKPDQPFAFSAIGNDGALLPLRVFRTYELTGRSPSTGNYPHWAQHHDPDPAPRPVAPDGPAISILLPVFNTPPEFLQPCIDSVIRQHYTRWELIIVDDGSTAAGMRSVLAAATVDSRIRLHTRAQNGGIARATNDALGLAGGDYVVLLDHDDCLRPHALAEIAAWLVQAPATDVVYSDEDKIDMSGRRITPFLKPAFSPEFLKGVMYPGHALCVRTALARQVGGFDPAFDGVQDYEFFLRLTERTREIRHLPLILYHWRRSPTSSALHGNVKGDMDARQLAAVRAHMSRVGDGRVARPAGGHRVRLEAGPDIAGTKLHLVRLARSQNPVEALLAAAVRTDGELLLLMSDAPTSKPPDWQQQLAALAVLPDSGCVAPILVSREGRILEAGCTFSHGRLIPLMTNFGAEEDGYHGAALCNREVAAVSPLCVAIRTAVVRRYAAEAGMSWLQFTERLREAGLYHRVCASTRIHWPLSCIGHSHPHAVPAGATDPFYHVRFRRDPGDYAFAPAGFMAHIDSRIEAELSDGCLIIQGWCFHDSGAPARVEAKVAGLAWSVPVNLPRPDVAAAHDCPAFVHCGFALHLRLPAGVHELILTASAGAGITQRIHRQMLHVPPDAPEVRSRSSDPARLLACQLPAAPLHPPRPLPRFHYPRSLSLVRDWPRFAVVTPSFQQAASLEETMRSVLGQTVACDYVVQDGESTDGSVEVIRRMARGGIRDQGSEVRGQGSEDKESSPRLIAWESAPDGGQADAINRGFAKTKGEPSDLMSWINSDDFYLPGALAYVADYMARHPEVDVVHGHRLLVDANSREIGRWHLPAHDPEVLRLYDFVPQETLFWRRSLWDRVGGLDTRYQFAMDWDLLLRFQAAGAHIVRLPRFLAAFRLSAEQKTSALIQTSGQAELDALRQRTFGRVVEPGELVNHPRLQQYLRRSARLDILAGWCGATSVDRPSRNSPLLTTPGVT